MTDEDYNGWKNYPTWAVHLWLTNEESDYDYWRNATLGVLREDWGDRKPRGIIADRLKDAVRGREESGGSSMGADLLGYAFDCVDWNEIADAWIEMCEEVPA
jgi:hypothetical protein